MLCALSMWSENNKLQTSFLFRILYEDSFLNKQKISRQSNNNQQQMAASLPRILVELLFLEDKSEDS